MIRAVVDTNVYISAMNYGGTPFIILQKARQKAFQLFVSDDILKEIREVLTTRFKWSPTEVEKDIEKILKFANLIEIEKRISVIKDDPDDDRILECGLAAHAHIIISGDNHLLKLNRFQETEIKRPRDFLDYLEIHKDILK